MSLDALRSLQKQADSCDVYDPDCSCAGCESLAALATHLLPIAEALEGLAVAKNHGFGCWARADEPDIRGEVEDGLDALKALQEALE